MNDYIYLCIIKKDYILIDESIKFPGIIKREETKKAFSLLKKMLNYLNFNFNIDSIKYTDNGKPYFFNSDIKFNYSHSKRYIACTVAMCDVGVDIEDEFEISDNARDLYLKDIKENYRKNWVRKEAYCKMIGEFDDDFFKELRINSNNYYEEANSLYDCILFYKDNNKTVKKLNLELE